MHILLFNIDRYNCVAIIMFIVFEFILTSFRIGKRCVNKLLLLELF